MYVNEDIVRIGSRQGCFNTEDTARKHLLHVIFGINLQSHLDEVRGVCDFELYFI